MFTISQSIPGNDENAEMRAVFRMGIQKVSEITMIRHAYVLSGHQVKALAARYSLRLQVKPGGRAVAGRRLGGRRVGDPLLRAPWCSHGLDDGEEPTAEDLLEDSLASDRNFGGTATCSPIRSAIR
ncbi:MAG: hypothetical protein WB660_14750 [Candidatus Sulfotelmatobacter sp.]